MVVKIAIEMVPITITMDISKILLIKLEKRLFVSICCSSAI